MPAEGIHLTALREAVCLGDIALPARRCVLRFEDAARLGSLGPDLPYFDRYLEAFVRYVIKRPARGSPWGARIHEGGAIDLVMVALDEARRQRSELLAALAIGLASHACIDRSIHPLVNALARRFPEGASHDDSHREVEKFQSVLFHESYYGKDHLGSPAIARVFAVPAFELISTTPVGAALGVAYATATGDSDAEKRLHRMAQGYGIHTRILGSPIGKRVATPSEKERARPFFLEGRWGRFENILEQAIAASRPVLEAVWAAFEATERDADETRAALARLLPAGSIEGQGRDIDLERPFVVRPPREVAA